MNNDHERLATLGNGLDPKRNNHEERRARPSGIMLPFHEHMYDESCHLTMMMLPQYFVKGTRYDGSFVHTYFSISVVGSRWYQTNDPRSWMLLVRFRLSLACYVLSPS
jgi:hypothetical protein